MRESLRNPEVLPVWPFLGANMTNTQDGICCRIEPAMGARFAFEVFKTGLMRSKKHVFEFESYHGEFRRSSSSSRASTISLTIAAGSFAVKDDWIGRGDQRRVLRMANKKMLAANRFPEINFHSSQIAPLSDDRFNVAGELVIRDMSRAVSVTLLVEAADVGQVRLSGSAQILLREFGLKPPAFLFGVVGTRNEIAVAFSLVGYADSQETPLSE